MNRAMRDLTAFNSLIAILYNPARPVENSALVCFCGRSAVGDTYADLGAIATDNQGDTLGYKTFLNGTLVYNIVIDTPQVATDTIDYVATDTWGNTSTSTRTVIVEAATSSPSIQ